MDYFYTKRKLSILKDYEQFLTEELKKPITERAGTLDKEHLVILQELIRNMKIRSRYTEEQSNNLFVNSYPKPIATQFELTSRCNQACIQCYNQSGLKKNITNNDMDISDWIEIAKELASIKIPQIIISGGEPTLLGDDLFRIMDIFHEVGTHFVLITNGSNITAQNIDKFAKYNYAWFQLSIDGASSVTHEFVRGAKGSFDKVINAALLARSRGIPIGIASTIVRPNLHEVDALIDLAYNLGAFKITIGEFMYAGRAITNKDEIALADKDIRHIRNVIIRKRSQYGRLINIIKPADPALALRYRMSSPATGLLIRPNGEVRIDCQAPARVGNVKKSNIFNIWNNVGYKGWSHPELLDYIEKIYTYKDLNNIYPRTHVDIDLNLSQE